MVVVQLVVADAVFVVVMDDHHVVIVMAWHALVIGSASVLSAHVCSIK